MTAVCTFATMKSAAGKTVVQPVTLTKRMPKLYLGNSFPTVTLQDIDGSAVEFPSAFVYESERYVPDNIKILGVSVEPAEEGKKLLQRVTRDCQEDRPHIRLDP